MKMKNSKAGLPLNNTSLKKMLSESIWNSAEKKQEENLRPRHPPHTLQVEMVVASPCSFDWLQESSWHSRLNNNVTEQMPWEKIGPVGGN